MTAPKRLVTREELRLRVNEQVGGNISKGTFDKMCAPKVGRGPPIAGWLGKKPLYDPDVGVAHVRSLITPTRSALVPLPPLDAAEQPAA